MNIYEFRYKVKELQNRVRKHGCIVIAVYKNPEDFEMMRRGKDIFVLRAFKVEAQNVQAYIDVYTTASRYEEIKKGIPEGLLRSPRMKSDVPSLIEIYISIYRKTI